MQKYYKASLPGLQLTCKKITFVVMLFLAGQPAGYSQFPNSLPVSTVSSKGPYAENDANLDALPPVITYTALGDTCYTGNRILIATITDADGVPTSGLGLPVLYWQINSALFTPVTGVSIGSNQYRFTFGSGVSPGTLVSYYIVAQDNLGNVIAKPSAGAGGYTTNPPAASTPPSTPSFYVIQTTLAAGTYNVGVGQTYLTLTDAINAYNNSCLGGAIVFVLTDATYDVSEIFPLSIGNPGASAVNTLTIKPNTGLNTTIQGTAADAIIKLNGADYITIDGSNSGGTTRNLAINNNSTNTLSSVIWVGSTSASNGATHNTIKNCNINGNATNTTYAAILSSSGITPGQAAEAANLSNSYINNSLTTSYYGMAVLGPSAGETGTIISNNTIGSTSATKKLGYRGLLISNQTNVQVNNNNIIGIVSSIGIGSDIEPAGGIIVSGAISGGSIYSNNINDVRNTNLGGWPAYGISLQSTTTAAGIKIYNNFIHSILGYGNATTVGNNGIGIAVLAGGGYGIYFNSVHLYAAQGVTGGGISAAIFIGPGATVTASLDIRDNIFSNRRATGVHYAIYSSVPVIVISNINYNDYYSAGFLGYLGSNRANIGAWQAATGMDGNSVAVNPIFVNPVSPVDLHLNPISPLNDQGITIPGITTDIDGITRSAAPDMGADEFTPPNCSGNTGGTAVSDFITVCTSGSVLLSATGFAYGVGIAYQWQSSTDGTNFINITGETNPTSANPPVINVTTWYRLKVTCSLTGGSPGYSSSVMVTVYNPAILTKTNGSRCGPGTVNLAATGSPTTAIQWYTTPTGGAPVYTGSPFTTPSLSATTTYYVESTYLGSSGTVGPVSPAAEGGTISTQLTSWEVTFNVIQATKLLTIDVYPLAIGENSVIDIYNSTGTIIASVPYTTTVGGGTTAQTVTMNVSLTIGNGYYLYATAGLPPTGLTRNITGAVYPYNSSDIQITGNGFDPNFYMCYYRWRFSNGCSSDPRSAVTATIGASTPVTISASPASVCAGECSIVTASSTNTAYVYTWTPGPQSGASITVCPTTTTTYTYTAVDGACTSTGSVLVTVKPVPSNVVITPGPTVTKCASAPAILLTATGGDIAGVPVLNENFNGATAPAGWVIANTSTGTAAQITASNWTLRPDGYTFAGTTFHSNDSTQFYLSNSDANPATTRTTLRSPAFSLVGYSSATIKFWQYFAFFGAPDSIAVEISQDGTTWTPVSTHTIYSSRLSKGVSTNFAIVNANMDPWAGLATNYIRFRYTGNDGFQWAIDNVTIAGGSGATPISWTPVTGLFTNASATTAYTGSPTATVYVKPAVTTTYTATANPVNSCPKSDTVRVTLRQITGAITADISNVCPSQTVNISIALTGTGPWSLTYTPGLLPAVTVNNILTSPYTFTVNPLVTTTYTLTALSDAYCTATSSDFSPASVLVTVSAVTNSTWLGINDDWMNPINWCGGVPTSTKNVVIPSGPAFFPVITTTLPVAKDIAIGNGASITINSGAKLSMTGNFTNNGTLTNYGTLTLNGTAAQSFPGGTTGIIAAFNNLTINNAAGVTFNKSFLLTGTLKAVAGTITLNNVTVTLHSDASGTARVDTLGATAAFAYVSGKFSVERYISSVSKKAWRFLAAPIQPLAGSQTINAAWQEGEIAPTYTQNGYGMQIVGPTSAGAGFDMNNTLPSVKKYNTSTNAWVTIPGTTGQISATDGYMAFIRGDRGSNTFTSPLSATTLRMAGQIKTGDVIISTANANINKYLSVGNPYPSAIDFASPSTIKTGLVDVYYLWDPKLGSYGGYQTFAGPGYIASAGGPLSSYNGNRFIESGQAFFVYSNSSVTAHSLTIKEGSKVGSNVQVARIGEMPKSLSTKLYLLSDSSVNLYDGNRVDFSSSYSNEVDDNDAGKMVNFGENLGLLRNGQSLAVERHSEIVKSDTIFYQLAQFRQLTYRMEFTPVGLAKPGLTAYLEDSYLNSKTIISLDMVSEIDFAVTSDPASKATDRFRIVFNQARPAMYTLLDAYQKEKDIAVTWNVTNEQDIVKYSVERSPNGINFTELGIQPSHGAGTAQSLYSWLDQQPLTGDNFYRVVALTSANDKLYSKIVLVNIAGSNASITISPNPVLNNTIGVNFVNEVSGDYVFRLFSMSGQLILNKTIHYQGPTERIELFSGTELSPGLYNLEILTPAPIKRRRVYKILVE